MTWPRTGAGVAAQAGWAAEAAAKADSTWSALAIVTSATTSDSCAGLVEVVEPASPATARPPMVESRRGVTGGPSG